MTWGGGEGDGGEWHRPKNRSTRDHVPTVVQGYLDVTDEGPVCIEVNQCSFLAYDFLTPDEGTLAERATPSRTAADTNGRRTLHDLPRISNSPPSEPACPTQSGSRPLD
ncbi:hypothetical protein GCM10029963_07980 [Micromonospora andamanensis]